MSGMVLRAVICSLMEQGMNGKVIVCLFWESTNCSRSYNRQSKYLLNCIYYFALYYVGAKETATS